MFYVLLLFIIFLSFIRIKYGGKKVDREPPVLSGGLPFVGHGFLFIGDSVKSYNNITWISEECAKNGGIVTGYLGFRKAYCITDPETIQNIANSCLEKEYFYDFAKAFVGDGLITGNGAIWKKHRRLLNPAFSQQVLNSFLQCFNSQARRLVGQLESQIGILSNHEPILRQNNLESICLTATGIGGDEYTSLQKKYLTLIPKFQIILYERFKRFWLHADFIYNFTGLKKKEKVLSHKCASLSNQIIQRKKEDIRTNGNCVGNPKTSEKVKPFLELLLDISKETKWFTDEQIRHETDTIIAAAHETSGTVLNLALIILGSYPEIQEKLYNEIVNVFGNSDRDLKKDDLTKLAYTEAVLKETLRLYPAVPVVARYIDRDIELENYTLKANSACFLMYYGLNRDPVWGLDANQFRPERWLELDTLPEKNYFGSFSLGKRNCIGKAYAITSMKITLAHLIRSYHVSADINKVVLKWHMLTYPASGHHYTLQQRTT